jgi:hypothetical protein
MSTQNKNAFATRFRNILEKYNLPTIITLMESVPPKEVWKRMVKNAVDVSLGHPPCSCTLVRNVSYPHD